MPSRDSYPFSVTDCMFNPRLGLDGYTERTVRDWMCNAQMGRPIRDWDWIIIINVL